MMTFAQIYGGPDRPVPRLLRGGWYEARQADSYVLARQWPPRFDVVASGTFPPVRRGRLARQIRQDLWRAFKHLRGFSPVVQVDATESGVLVSAGGRIIPSQPIPSQMVSEIQALLDSPAHRARWLAWAQGGTR